MSVRIGCNLDHKAEFETALGRSVDVLRVYGAALTTSGVVATAKTYSAAGYDIVISFNNIQSHVNVAAGAEDPRWHAIGAHLATFAGPVWFDYKHEVENDTGIVASEYRPACGHVYSIIKADAPAVQTVRIYLGGFQGAGNQFTAGTTPDQFMPVAPNIADVVGVDYYNWRGGPGVNPWASNNNIRDVNDVEILGGSMNSWMEYATTIGKPIMFPEFGCAITQPGNPLGLTQPGAAGRAAWLQSFADRWKNDTRILSCQYFELNGGESGAVMNWRISGGANGVEPASMAAFDSFSGGGVVTPPAGTKVLLID